MIPGMYPKMVRSKQMKNSVCKKKNREDNHEQEENIDSSTNLGETELTVQQPWRRQTPRGGIKIASMIAQKSSHLPPDMTMRYFTAVERERSGWIFKGRERKSLNCVNHILPTSV